ncbi:MAG: DUF3137 domain-containing protein [Candidatus Izemoplasmatales bacterium]|nr:DUF3137 domain-containing protein [Candidatus Izemoplasmatales bacterium]
MPNQFDVFNTKKKTAEKQTVIGMVLIGIAVILFLGMQASGSTGFLIFAIIAGIPGLIFAAKGATDFKKLSRSFKQEVVIPMFQEAIPGVQYRPDYGLSEMEVYNTEMLKRADRFHSEDFISGQLESVQFISSDVRLEERHVEHTKNGTRTYYVTYFLGRVFKFSFNKEFDGYLQVLEGGSPMSRRDFKKVKLESIDFNKKFKTFATSELSAFYVLTPDIMESIMNLEKRNPGRIGLSFTGENLYITINNNKDTFELKMFRQIDQSVVDEFRQDLMVIKDVIVAMKLNNNLFKKAPQN